MKKYISECCDPNIEQLYDLWDSELEKWMNKRLKEMQNKIDYIESIGLKIDNIKDKILWK